MAGAGVDETWSIAAELAAYDVDGTWFGLGDRDIATHLVRTQMLEAGFGLAQVTEALCQRWQPGVRLLPMTDDRVETHVAIPDADAPSGQRAVHFQEYWVRLRAEVPALAVVAVGIEAARPAPGVLEAIADADLIIVPPSNPVVSVGPILGVPGIRAALDEASAPIVGISPIIGGDHVRGMARQLLTAIDVEVSAAGVGLHYGARGSGGLLDGWLVDTADAAAVAALSRAGITAAAVPLLMTDDEATAAIARAADRVGQVMLEVSAPDGIGEIVPGDDLAAVLLEHADLADGDIVVVTSKVVSKAEGRVRAGDSAISLPEETQRVVARAGSVTIVRSRLGITHAMAGLDASNVPRGSHILLPEDPDASARALRERVREETGLNIAVLVSDTAGRAWRMGQTEIAIGAAGLAVLEDYVGAEDGYGNVLKVTQPCVADELCDAAELVSGKTTRRPFAIIRGRADLVCAPDVVGSGAAHAGPADGTGSVRVRSP